MNKTLFMHFIIAICLSFLVSHAFGGKENFEVKVLRRDSSPLLSFVDHTSEYQQIFNPTWVPASKGTKGKSGLLSRTQNCDSAVGASSPTWCGGAQDKASILTFSESLHSDHQFTNVTTSSVVFGPSTTEDSWGTEDPRMIYNAFDELYYMMYTAYNGSSILLSLATSPNPIDANQWTKHGAVFPDQQGSKSGALLLGKTAQGPHYLLWGDHDIRIASSNDLYHWSSMGDIIISPRADSFDSRLVESGPPPLLLSNGDYLFFYNSAEVGWPEDLTKAYHVGYVILDGQNPAVIKQRSSAPLLSPKYAWETGQSPYTCNAPNVVFLEAAHEISRDRFRVFFGGADATIGSADIEVQIHSHV